MSCQACEPLKASNKELRKALTDTNRNYVEVVNENLALRREIETLRKGGSHGSTRESEEE